MAIHPDSADLTDARGRSELPLKVAGEPQERLAGAPAVVLALVFALSLALFAYAWFLSLERPGVSGFPEGYYRGFDQSAYKHEAEDLARGELPSFPEEYPYGLGYPLLAVPQVLLGFGRDPFALPNGLIFATCITLVVATGARLRSVGLGLAAGILVVFASPMLGMMVYPWSVTVTVLAVLVATAATVRAQPPRWTTGLAVGLAAALALAARYVDVVFPLAILGFTAIRKPRLWWKPALVTAAVVAVAGAVIGFTHQQVFGSFLTTPYSIHIRPGEGSDDSLSSYDLRAVPRAGVELFGSGRDGRNRVQADPLLRLMPWVVAAPFGLLLVAKRRHPLLWPVLGAALTSAVGTVFYLSFWGSRGWTLPMGTLRYFEPWFGVWAILAAYAGAGFLDWAARRRKPAPA